MQMRSHSETALRLLARKCAPAALMALAATTGISALPVTTVHPGYTLVNLRPTDFEPMVTGMGFLSDGRLVLSHWGGLHDNVHLRQTKGKVYILSNITGDTPSPVVSTYAENLEDPVGMLVMNDRIYVTGGEKLIELPDADKNGKAEAARVIVTIPGTHARHEFLFGAVFKDGKFWMNPSSGKDVKTGLPAWGQTNPNRGTMMSVDSGTGAYQVHAMGLREPNGIGLGPEDELFVPDVQGNWLPANKLIHVKKGRFYGFKHEPAETWDNMAVSPAAVFLPQPEAARAPGNPLYIKSGIYAGQMLMGDAVTGGINRIFLEKVANEYQGAAIFFSGGFEAGPHRLLWGPDGHLYAGMCGQGAPDWAYRQDYGLQKLKSNGKTVFEMLAVRSRQGGMEIEYTAEINAAAENKAKYTVRTWHYTSTSDYGGPAQATKTHTIASVRVSPDRKKVFLEIPDLAAGKVVNIKLAADIASMSGDVVWTQETWYTLNAISPSVPFATVGLAEEKTLRENAWDKGIRVGWESGRLIVQSPQDGKSMVQVRNLRGILVAEAAGGVALAPGLSTAGWAPGVYTVQVRQSGFAANRRIAVP